MFWEESDQKVLRTENTENLVSENCSAFQEKNILRLFCFPWTINYRVVIHGKVSCIVICTGILTSCKSKIKTNLRINV